MGLPLRYNFRGLKSIRQSSAPISLAYRSIVAQPSLLLILKIKENSEQALLQIIQRFACVVINGSIQALLKLSNEHSYSDWAKNIITAKIKLKPRMINFY